MIYASFLIVVKVFASFWKQKCKGISLLHFLTWKVLTRTGYSGLCTVMRKFSQEFYFRE